MHARSSGFSLVEIAIALVIIGLLLGGVLKGQELIVGAKIKNLAGELNGVTAAVYAYQDRYKAFPGDDRDAITKARWATTVTGGLPGGDGNGRVSDGAGGTGAVKFNTTTASEEPVAFWRHLRAAGLISGDGAGTDLPGNAAGGVTGIQDGAGTAPAQLSGPVLCTSNLEAKIAAALDSQLDDGKPNTGSIFGFEQAGTVTAGSAEPTRNAAAATYAESDAAKLYCVCKRL